MFELIRTVLGFLGIVREFRMRPIGTFSLIAFWFGADFKCSSLLSIFFD